MRRLLWLALVLLVPFGALIALAYVAASRGVAGTLRVLIWSRVWSLVYRVPYTLVAAVLHNEGASRLRHATPAEDDVLPAHGELVYPVGDIGVSSGPSYGPGQVLRANIERLWGEANFVERLIAVPGGRDAALLALPGYERHALWASLQVLREAYVAASGDPHAAARRYNGSGSAAEAYADRADTFREQYSTGGKS